jgi:hypothetical protein
MNALRVVRFDDLCSEVVDAEEFIRIFNEELDTIKRVEVVPPKLGEPGFGRIRVVRKHFVPRIDWDNLTENER